MTFEEQPSHVGATEDETTHEEKYITFKCLEVEQPIGTFYVGVLSSQDLIRVSKSDVRRIKGELRGVETYLGIERPLNPKRVEQLMNYVRTVDAAFPSAVIVAVDSKHTESSRV